MVTLVTATSLEPAHQRAQRDLVAAERQQRQAAENLARELARVLQEIATLQDGNRLEAMRREDPKVPQYWTAADWRKFFAKIPAPVKDGWTAKESLRIAELERTIAELRSRLAETETLLQVHTAVPVPAEPAQSRAYARQDAEATAAPASVLFDGPAESTPPLSGLLARARQVWGSLPAACPASFHKTLSGGGRTGGDLKKAYQRYWLTLYLVGACRINARFEIEDLLAQVAGMSSRAGSLGRIVEDLQQAGLLIGEILRIGAPKTSLRLVRLAPDGVRLFKILFDRDPLETDWERMIRLHEGDRFPEHTLAVLIFALHARKRGWATQILPPVEGTKAVPDLLVERGDERLYVEVELGRKESPAKWRNQAKLNNGRVALCAATSETRQRLVGDCRLDKLAGLAADLDTLVKVKHSTITEQDPLWIETW